MEELSTLGVSSIMGIELGRCVSNSNISDLVSQATGISSSGGVGGSVAGYSPWYAGGEFQEGDAVNGLGPRDTVVESRRRESADLVRDSARGDPCEERCSQDGKFTFTLLLDRKRETGDGRVRSEPCEARRRILAGLEVSCVSEV